jgi:Type I phosphodiesterase / nucleotide pyrophosphatase
MVVEGQGKRLVLVKVDGLPADRIERLIQQIDPETGRSVLPWMHYIFVERGAWVQNFYVRGISLSAPSWSMLDTGQHLTIRGNAEFDRFIPRVYDYLNFFPFYVGYSKLQRADMPGVEVLDQFGVPLLLDQFPPENRRESMQLFQRGVRWTTLRDSIKGQVTRPARELLNEFETGLEMAPGIDREEEKELIEALADPKIQYLDYYLGDYDHTAHLTNDDPSQLAVIKHLDDRLGRLWKAIQASPLAAETILALVSDHGMNSSPSTYSQGYNLVKFFNSGVGGGHHVVTVRYPLTEYKLSGLDPFVSWVVTPSPEASYLRNQNDYPTVLLDPDGNERASAQLRNSDLNTIQILLQQLKRKELTPAQRSAARKALLKIVDENRPRWTSTVAELNEELIALLKAIERQQAINAADPRTWPKPDQPHLRHLVTLDTWQTEERGYKEYARSLQRLLDLKESDLEPGRIHVENLIPKGAMGDPNSLRQLQNYVTGLSERGIVLRDGGSLDLERTFNRVNYFTVLSKIRVRNLVQKDLGVMPVDFVAVRIPQDALTSSLPPRNRPDSDVVFVSDDDQHQALLLPQHREGTLWLRYVPVHDLVQDPGGSIHFSEAAWADGFPLHLFEDPDLRVNGDRGSWLSGWHTEREWFEAVHRTRYSNGVISLQEMFQHWQPEAIPVPFQIADKNDWPVLRRFAARRRELTESDLLILAADHWNFNVRGFNPGGNHGSFLRISTHSLLMAEGTGIPEGLVIDRPYDSLSLVPTLLSLLERLPRDGSALYPGPVIKELTYSQSSRDPQATSGPHQKSVP